MPATSEKQKRFMDAAAHNPSFAKKVGVPQSVAQEFSGKSKGMSFGKGDSTRVDRQGINKPKTDHGNSSLFKKGGDTMASKMNPGFMAMMAKKSGTSKMAKGGMTEAKMGSVRTAAPSKDGIASKGKTKGTMIKMSGSTPLGMKRGGKAG